MLTMKLLHSTLILLGTMVMAQEPDKSLSLPEKFSSPVKRFDTDGSVSWSKDQVTLTPLDKGNQHGAIWTNTKNTFSEWTFEVSLTASGPTSPGGGLALWYAGNPNQAGPVHGSRDYWDGLGIFLDSETSSGEGTLRGHLNDGSIGYRGFSQPADKAFSLCKINYRNTGAQFTLRVGYGQGSVIVDVNGQKCFETDAVSLPKDLYFGISASSTANPDSFVVHKFNVYPTLLPDMAAHRPGGADNHDKAAAPPPPQQQQPVQQQQQPRDMQQAQVNEILQKIDQTNQKLNSFDKLHSSVNDLMALRQQLSGLEGRMDRMEGLVKEVRSNLGSGGSDDGHKQQLSKEMQNLRTQLDQVSNTVTEHTSSILGTLPDTVNQAISKGGPSIWIVFALIVVVQGVLIVGYNVYKTRRSYHAKIL